MRGNYNTLLKTVVGVEGGISDRPLKADPGGLTNKGVTQKTYNRWRVSQGMEPRSVRELTVAEYTKLYKTDFWDLVKGDELPSGLDCAMFDYCVNSGPRQPVVDLQRALGCAVDGIIGPATMGAIKVADLPVVIGDLCDRRLRFMHSLKNWQANKNGWTRRVAHIRDVSLGLVCGTAGQVPEVPAPVMEDDTAKALPVQQAKLKTAEGAGLSAASVGVGGQSLLNVAHQIQPHIAENMIGRAATAAFIAVTAIGATLVGYSYLTRVKEAGGFNNFLGGLLGARN